MFIPTLICFSPTDMLKEEFLTPGFGIANVASFFKKAWYVYPTAPAISSTLSDGLIKLIRSFSVLFVKCSNWPENPLWAAPCSKAFLQASLYVAPVLTHRATINGISVIRRA